MESVIINGMRNLDFHIFVEQLLSIASITFPKNIWKSIAEINLFFRDLCSTILKDENSAQMEGSIIFIIKKLENTFPSKFFNGIEHLSIYFVHEARLDDESRWTVSKCNIFKLFLNFLIIYLFLYISHLMKNYVGPLEN